uniref:Uncharacterized protein n=1 Tax=Pyrodinium bahamense TaxID=73915 RepID=A0A7S0FG30_9DINO|mmetsp:Transcript_27794/g.76512  ORF Transcript_27794/g.76512 Transcript_27794/m.76512 type:complete len:395 (+) Transcript_27794:63-1247(+)|eukprot:CAMPEP_0179039870 /NCGR_PEP_ID=MMETSP0796-20121207/15358_1 /TAXON_ID=73915 /ORGANISM="Pyrodinium bahamense, Strain pbaha01" /LENGTH=394 /DNA_ID=CAMNT_0020736205 /DNA_START=57 /DNA_END=1241 /DNA_ORIENTATION=-
MSSSAADGELQRKIEEYKAREHIYLAGLIGQEAGMSHLRRMASDVLGAYGDISRAAVRGSLVDPTQNMEVLLLRQKALEKDQQISQLREELEANRFDQRVPSGQALMRKCKALLTENRELGDEIREERLAELSAAVQAEQRQNAHLFQKCREAIEFCTELSQENEKLQGTIAKVAGRLREARNELDGLRKERAEAKAKRKKEREQQKKAAEAAAAAQAVAGAAQPVPTEAAPAAPVATTASLGQPSVFEAGPAAAVVVASTAEAAAAESAAAPAVAAVRVPSAALPAVAQPGVAVPPGAIAGSPAPVLAAPTAGPTNAAADAVIGALPVGVEPVEKDKKKKRKSDAGEEGQVKDKKEKKRRKAEKAAAAAAAVEHGNGSGGAVHTLTPGGAPPS